MKASDAIRRGDKVLVGLSGGVDSSVAALLLLEQGLEVTGIMMSVYDGPPGASGGNACYDCAEKRDIESAASSARQLGIPFHVFDCAQRYRHDVLDYFRDAYLDGKTPNPCIHCNRRLKFDFLPALAERRGLHHDFFATGHYARVEFSEQYGCCILRRGLDAHKDQSYFLYRLEQEQLRRALFPLGNMRKAEVRALARERGLPVHDRADSQDFYSGDYTELLGIAPRPGNIVDESGKVLGKHAGFWNFTPGQRRGLGIAASEPLYVVRVDAATNEVVVGGRDATLSRSCLLEDLYIGLPQALCDGMLQAQVRSSQQPFSVQVTPGREKNTMVAEFAEAQHAVAPGQSLVLYLGDIVVGGGIIC
ncbi:MAG: tRNA 2-thiouridine(34) synthase MnmA [Desulfovibrio sp.]|jgi:tRNA-specific 2-thiouridylase|nr:tRNA 2-thiouridine(34) synthase MnmA [Desulfovibrio sp.]